jgi:hypothetical protein
MDTKTPLDRLLGTWEEARGDAPLPPHSRFGAEQLRPWLPSVTLVEVYPGPRRFFYRLAGTELERIYGMSFAGRWLEDLRIPGSDGYWEKQYAAVAASRQPLGGSVAHFDLERNQKTCRWLMLPLLPDRAPMGGTGPLDLVILACVLFEGR